MAEDKLIDTFKDLGVCEQLVEACENLGWKIPSKIQAEAIPHALDGLFSYLINLFLSCSVLISLILFLTKKINKIETQLCFLGLGNLQELRNLWWVI